MEKPGLSYLAGHDLSRRGCWAGLAAALLALPLLAGCSLSARGPGLDRSDLGGKPSPEFSLLDQSGQEVRLSDWKGKVVALTFLYSSCPDVCPIVTQTFGGAYDKLGTEIDKVVFAAVSADPQRDTVEQSARFLDAQKLSGKMSFLTADRPALEAVWAAYHIGVIKQPPPTTSTGGTGFY